MKQTEVPQNVAHWLRSANYTNENVPNAVVDSIQAILEGRSKSSVLPPSLQEIFTDSQTRLALLNAGKSHRGENASSGVATRNSNWHSNRT